MPPRVDQSLTILLARTRYRVAFYPFSLLFSTLPSYSRAQAGLSGDRADPGLLDGAAPTHRARGAWPQNTSRAQRSTAIFPLGRRARVSPDRLISYQWAISAAMGLNPCY
jgi:hypothetical protein